MNNIVYGGDLMLFVASGETVNPLAFSNSAKLSISTATREITTKDSGNFVEKALNRSDWNVSSDGLMSYSISGATQQNIDNLFDLMMSRELINVSFGEKTGTSPSWTVNASKSRYSGQGYITSLELNASDNDSATYSITIEGSGTLKLS